MASEDLIRAACCVAGTDDRVTVEELQVLGTLAGSVGIEKRSLNSMIADAQGDAGLRREQLAVAQADAEIALTSLVRAARGEGAPLEGTAAILLWRLATTLEIAPDRFEAILAEETAGS